MEVMKGLQVFLLILLGGVALTILAVPAIYVWAFVRRKIRGAPPAGETDRPAPPVERPTARKRAA